MKELMDHKMQVERGYDRCSEIYTATRDTDPPDDLSLLTGRLADGAEVLDVGCGSGIPITRALAERFAVTGVDISAGQIRRASANVPTANLIHGDIMAAEFPAASFDAIVGFYAIFHLPREEHAELFRRMHSWLRRGGYLLATLAEEGEPTHSEEDFFGTTMWWSFFGLPEYTRILETTGFRILETVTLGHGFDDKWKGPEERHPLVLAQRE
jgi:cyclopropane fatty-acyl-phospholipid synthase-like methyltransferase